MRVACALLLAATPAVAQQKPTLTPADYAKWESLGATELSPDGRWLAHVVTRVDDEEQLRIREIASDSTRVVPHASRPGFSRDGRWLAYSIGMSTKERETREQSGQSTRSSLGLLDLRTGAVTVIENVASYAFSTDGAFLAMRGYPASGRSSQGVDLVVRNLANGTNTSFGNIAAFAWRDRGAVLAMIVDAEHRAGNGVAVFDPATRVLRTLESDTATFSTLVWRRDADDLAVLRVRADSAYEDPTHVVIAWRGVTTPRTVRFVLDASKRSDMPRDMRIVDLRELRWNADGTSIFLATKEWQRKEVAQPDSVQGAPQKDAATVDVWHAADIDIVPEQKVQSGFERSRSYLAAWHLNNDRYVQIADSVTPDVTIWDGRYASGLDSRPYEKERMFGPTYRDIYVIDVMTGTRERIAQRVQFQYGPSQTGRYVLYVRDGHYWTYDTRTRRHTNITSKLPTSFINVDDDHTVVEKPPFGQGGWTTDDRSVLLYDRYDIWDVKPDGSGGTNLTQGRADRVQHRRVWLSPDDRVVDLTQPVYTTLYGERTKQSGWARLRANMPAERLVFLDRSVSRLTKAAAADVFSYRVEAFDDSPDVFVGSGRLADARQMTHTNPFQAEYAWGRATLIDYKNVSGRELQAALLYPANYEPGRQYPMIVYTYEITSNTLHHYTVPSEYISINPTVFTQNGYFVLRPDVVYRPRNPGISAVEALVPAVEKALETGAIDRGRIGIAGHSWGAYQTAFTVTQTDMFKAGVAGAPLTDLISMYLSVYWNTGGTDAKIFETGQGRMEVPFWEDVETYMRNSPLFSIQKLNTPLLVAFGDKDGAVDWHQGIELYNAARRAGKPVVMLVYEGENHSLARKSNQVDYHRRINEWFAHYLKGEPAPAWITAGVKVR